MPDQLLHGARFLVRVDAVVVVLVTRQMQSHVGLLMRTLGLLGSVKTLLLPLIYQNHSVDCSCSWRA